jgi:diaminopimelate decarboxylase
MAAPFSYDGGRLSASGVALADLAAEFGTPLYVYDLAAVAARIAAVREAFASHPTRLCYSVKANSNLRLLAWLAGRGLGFDVVSGGELARTEAVGIPPRDVVFAGVGKTPEELAAAVRAGLWMVNVESVEEVEALERMAREMGREGVAVSLRLNPDVDARTHRHITTGRGVDKFGIALAEYDVILDRLTGRGELALVGLHMHIGSQITEAAPYAQATEVLVDAARRARERGHGIRWVNAGGGFGIAYGARAVPSPADYAAAILPAVGGLEAELVLELGRYLVGPAGCLLTRLLYRKERGGRALAIVDAGMTDLLRPALYEAEHRIVPLEEPDLDRVRPTDVAGPICESSDFLGRERPLPPLEPGALLAILDAGAYGMAMASHYNSHPRPAEVWITEGGSVELIRRRETIDDLLAVEREALGG